MIAFGEGAITLGSEGRIGAHVAENGDAEGGGTLQKVGREGRADTVPGVTFPVSRVTTYARPYTWGHISTLSMVTTTPRL